VIPVIILERTRRIIDRTAAASGLEWHGIGSTCCISTVLGTYVYTAVLWSMHRCCISWHIHILYV